jgi:hypothetical protein
LSRNVEQVRALFGFIDAGQPDRRAEVMTQGAVQRWPQRGEVMR